MSRYDVRANIHAHADGRNSLTVSFHDRVPLSRGGFAPLPIPSAESSFDCPNTSILINGFLLGDFNRLMPHCVNHGDGSLCGGALALIQKLRAENEELRRQLQAAAAANFTIIAGVHP